MKKNKKDKITTKILSILKETDEMNYSDIKKELEERYSFSPQDRILTYNLQKLTDLGIINETENQMYRYTDELGKGAIEDIVAMLERTIDTIFEEYGYAVSKDKLKEVIEKKTEDLVEEKSEDSYG